MDDQRSTDVEKSTERCDKEDVHDNHDGLTASMNRYTVEEMADYHSRAGAGSHSPCHSGGLHMPDQFRISDFVRRVKRLRYFSQCLPINNAALQGSPGSGSSLGTVVDSFSASGSNQPTTRKRSNSCPNLRQLETVSNWERIKEDVKEETLVAATQQSVESQTEDLWPPTPYEHLFFSVLPPSLLFPPPTVPAETAPRVLAPSELLDRYIDAAFRNHERQTILYGKPNATEDVTLLKGSTCFHQFTTDDHSTSNRMALIHPTIPWRSF